MTTGAARTEWERWCTDREQFLRAVPGNLALIANQPLGDEPEPVDFVDGVAAWFVPGEAGVRLRLDPWVAAEVAGERVSGEAFLPRLGPGGPLPPAGPLWVRPVRPERAAHRPPCSATPPGLRPDALAVPVSRVRPCAPRGQRRPVMMTAASSIPSGRSCASLILSARRLRIDASSVIVPLSDSVTSAPSCSAT